MEHSKLLWKTETCPLHPGCTDIVTSDGKFVVCVRGDKPEVAEHIVKACNEHEELKRKSEIFDELVVAYRKRFAINDNPVSLMVLVDEFAALKAAGEL